MDPAKKESILGDLRLANAFFDTASRLPAGSIIESRQSIRRQTIQTGIQLLNIAIARIKEGSE